MKAVFNLISSTITIFAILIVVVSTQGCSGAEILSTLSIVGELSGKKTSTVETEKAVKISKKMVLNFQKTMVAVNKGQVEAFEAFGRVVDAKRARQAASIFEKGIGDAEIVKALVAETKARDKIIQEIMLKKDKLTGQPRKHLAKSAEVYVGASVAGKNLLKDIKELKNASKEAMLVVKNNPMLLPSFTKDMEPGLYVVSELPVLSLQWVTTTVSLVAYAKINGDVIQVIKNLNAEKQP